MNEKKWVSKLTSLQNPAVVTGNDCFHCKISTLVLMYLWFSQMNFSVWVSEWCWHGWLMCVNKHHSHNSVFVAFLASFFCSLCLYSCTVPLANTSCCIHARQQHINARHLALHWQVCFFQFTGVEWNLWHESPHGLHMLQPGPRDVRNATFVQNEDSGSLMQDMTDAVQMR